MTIWRFCLMLSITLLISGVDTEAQVKNMNPVWSPDGSRLAFVSNRDGNPEIYVVDGKAVENLTQHEGLDLSPAWSHGGRRIAFVSNRDGQNDIYILELTDGTLRRLTERGDVLTSSLSWSPDDRWLAHGVGTHRDANL